MKKVILFVSILMIFAACSKKVDFSVNGTLDDRAYNGKNIVFRKPGDGQTIVDDTIKITKSAFNFKGSVDAPEVRVVVIPDANIQAFTVVLEKGDVKVDIHGDSVVIGGTPLNDKLQERNRQNQVIVNQIAALDKAYSDKVAAGPLSSDEEATYKKDRNDLLVKNTDNIIAFTKENIGNSLGKYFFMKYYINFPPERKKEMMDFATDDLKAMYAK